MRKLWLRKNLERGEQLDGWMKQLEELHEFFLQLEELHEFLPYEKKTCGGTTIQPSFHLVLDVSIVVYSIVPPHLEQRAFSFESET